MIRIRRNASPIPPGISVVFPCYNEEKSVAACVKAARRGLKLTGNRRWEIIVVDNNSTDRSAVFARKAGATVIREKHCGYGAALDAGIRKAKGPIVIMGDCDGTYPFDDLIPFLRAIGAGADLVLGSRFTGKIQNGAMPFFNRFVGNPFLTAMVNLFYRTNISDTQSGMRAFTKTAYRRLNMKSTGMEYASEMIIKARAVNLRVDEVPITYATRIGTSKLSPVQDAWRHVMSILIYSPTYAFVLPGALLFATGLTLTLLLIRGPVPVPGHYLDIHTMIAGTLVTTIGLYAILLGIFARAYAITRLGIRGGKLSAWIMKYVTPGTMIFTGMLFILVSGSALAIMTADWIRRGLPSLSRTREFIAMAGLATIGGQLLFSSFLFGLLKQDA